MKKYTLFIILGLSVSTVNFSYSGDNFFKRAFSKVVNKIKNTEKVKIARKSINSYKQGVHDVGTGLILANTGLTISSLGSFAGMLINSRKITKISMLTGGSLGLAGTYYIYKGVMAILEKHKLERISDEVKEKKKI